MELDNNEAAFSFAFVQFAAQRGTEEYCLVVGTAQETHLMPRRCQAGYLHTYRVLEGGRALELMHKVRAGGRS